MARFWYWYDADWYFLTLKLKVTTLIKQFVQIFCDVDPLVGELSFVYVIVLVIDVNETPKVCLLHDDSKKTR